MAITTVTVSGSFTKPSGEILANGRVVFTLTRAASDADGMLNATEVVALTDAQGAFSVQLWPNSRYDYPTAYAVVGYDTADRGYGYDFGRIVVPQMDSNIADLLPLGVGLPVADTATIIKGDTLFWDITQIDANGQVVPLTGSTVAARIIHKTGFEAVLPVTVTNASAGRFTITAPSTSWLTGRYDVRISITTAGIVKTQSGVLVVK